MWHLVLLLVTSNPQPSFDPSGVCMKGDVSPLSDVASSARPGCGEAVSVSVRWVIKIEGISVSRIWFQNESPWVDSLIHITERRS